MKIRIRLRKPRVHELDVWWPVCSVRSWVEVLLQKYPQFLLAGYEMEEEDKWRGEFTNYWNLLKTVDPGHPIFQSQHDLSSAIPVFTHGDEGRGHFRNAFLVQSFQTAIPHRGSSFTNMSGSLWLHLVSLQHSTLNSIVFPATTGVPLEAQLLLPVAPHVHIIQIIWGGHFGATQRGLCSSDGAAS